jgi:hypothetical protein
VGRHDASQAGCRVFVHSVRNRPDAKGTEKAVYICSISLVYRTMTCHRVRSMPFGLDMDMAFALY